MKAQRVVSLLIVCIFSSHARAELPEKNGEKLDGKIWGAYTYHMLARLFPAPHMRAAQQEMKFVFMMKTARPEAGIIDSRTVLITRGLLDIVKNEEEYAFIGGHEFGHIWLKHKPAPPLTLFFKTIRSFAQSAAITEKHEIEADDFATSAMRENGYSPCAGRDLLERLNERSGRPADPKKNLNYQIGLHRIETLLASAKRLQPHEALNTFVQRLTHIYQRLHLLRLINFVIINVAPKGCEACTPPKR